VALGIDSASNRDEYQEYPRWSKSGWYIGLTNVLTVMKSGSVCLSVRPSIHPLHLESQPTLALLPSKELVARTVTRVGRLLQKVDF
jgi:hypothetical protein